MNVNQFYSFEIITRWCIHFGGSRQLLQLKPFNCCFEDIIRWFSPNSHELQWNFTEESDFWHDLEFEWFVVLLRFVIFMNLHRMEKSLNSVDSQNRHTDDKGTANLFAPLNDYDIEKYILSGMRFFFLKNVESSEASSIKDCIEL